MYVLATACPKDKLENGISLHPGFFSEDQVFFSSPENKHIRNLEVESQVVYKVFEYSSSTISEHC